MVKKKMEELLGSMKPGHVPKSTVVGEDLVVAEENGDLVELDVEVAATNRNLEKEEGSRDHCQDDLECTFRKAERVYANTCLND